MSSIEVHDEDAVAIGMGGGKSHIFLFFSTLFGGASLRFFVLLVVEVVAVNVIPVAARILILVVPLFASSPVT